MSKIYVDEIAGIANANTVAIPGHVIQVVQEEFKSGASTASTTYQASGLIASVTPTSTSSKILVSVNGGGGYAHPAGAGLDNKLYRQIASGGYSAIISSQLQDWEHYAGTSEVVAPHSFTYLDTPNTTSQVDYQPYFRVNPQGPAGTVQFNVGFFDTGADDYGVVTITLMEIAG